MTLKRDKNSHPYSASREQIEIEQKVIESFNGRKQAKDLLEHAKRAVEIAIEQSEQAAIDSLESILDASLEVANQP